MQKYKTTIPIHMFKNLRIIATKFYFEEMHKIEKTSTSLSSPWQTIQSATNCWSFAIKSFMFGFRVGNHMCVKSPGGRQMPDPRAVPNLLMPHPRD